MLLMIYMREKERKIQDLFGINSTLRTEGLFLTCTVLCQKLLVYLARMRVRKGVQRFLSPLALRSAFG